MAVNWKVGISWIQQKQVSVKAVDSACQFYAESCGFQLLTLL